MSIPLMYLHSLENFEEGVGHPASKDHGVYLVQQVSNQLNLVMYLSTVSVGVWGDSVRDVWVCVG